VFLVSSAFSNGGVGIWSTHYIANRALTLYNGEPELQLEYDAGYTVLSFFMPVGVLLSAYTIIGAVQSPRFWRLILAGTFSGVAVCGMHYLVPNSSYTINLRGN